MSQRLSKDRSHEISPSWQFVSLPGFQKISREFSFDDFAEAVGFVCSLVKIVEDLDHHPDIHIYNNRVVVETWTHTVGKVTEKDYNLARKVDSLFVLG